MAATAMDVRTLSSRIELKKMYEGKKMAAASARHVLVEAVARRWPRSSSQR